MNELSIEEKIRLILKRKGMTIQSLADGIGQSRQRIHQAFRHGSFDTDWLESVAKAMGCNLTITFTDSETGEEY